MSTSTPAIDMVRLSPPSGNNHGSVGSSDELDDFNTHTSHFCG